MQVAALGSVALYTAYYVGDAKVAAVTLYAVVGTLAAVWAISFGTLLQGCSDFQNLRFERMILCSPNEDFGRMNKR